MVKLPSQALRESFGGQHCSCVGGVLLKEAAQKSQGGPKFLHWYMQELSLMEQWANDLCGDSIKLNSKYPVVLK